MGSPLVARHVVTQRAPLLPPSFMNLEIEQRVIRELADPFVLFRGGRLIDPATHVDLDWRSIDGMEKVLKRRFFDA